MFYTAREREGSGTMVQLDVRRRDRTDAVLTELPTREGRASPRGTPSVLNPRLSNLDDAARSGPAPSCRAAHLVIDTRLRVCP